MDSTARLIIHVGTEPERELALGEGDVLIGRDANNELVVQDNEASRRHTRVSLETDGYVVEDLGSTNGTFVNGQRVTGSQLLHDGDTITLGRAVRLQFVGHAPTLGLDPMAAEPPSGDTAAVFAPPVQQPQVEYAQAATIEPEPAPAAVAPRPRPPIDVERERGCQRYFIYTGCGVLSLLLLSGIAVFVVDRVAPEALYCGGLEPIWETVLNPILKIFDRTFDCDYLGTTKQYLRGF